MPTLAEELEQLRRTPLDEISVERAGEVTRLILEPAEQFEVIDVARFGSSI